MLPIAWPTTMQFPEFQATAMAIAWGGGRHSLYLEETKKCPVPQTMVAPILSYSKCVADCPSREK